MKYSTNIYYNSNETVLKAVQQYIKEEYDIDLLSREGFLFIPNNVDDKTFNELSHMLEDKNSPFKDRKEMEVRSKLILNEMENEEAVDGLNKIIVEMKRKLESGDDYAPELDVKEAMRSLVQGNEFIREVLIEDGMSRDELDKMTRN
ncbi:hypothetical protein FNJ21_004269 [Vibrio fluvialis]|nr:hypothetical protein [Vibrio fluvialis]